MHSVIDSTIQQRNNTHTHQHISPSCTSTQQSKDSHQIELTMHANKHVSPLTSTALIDSVTQQQQHICTCSSTSIQQQLHAHQHNSKTRTSHQMERAIQCVRASQSIMSPADISHGSRTTHMFIDIDSITQQQQQHKQTKDSHHIKWAIRASQSVLIPTALSFVNLWQHKQTSTATTKHMHIDIDSTIR